MIKKYYYEEDNFKLIQGDSLKVLRNIEPNSVDMVFADPPYFLSNNGISSFLKFIKSKTGVDISKCVRTYDRKNIVNVRLIEYDEWFYIPHLSFKGSIRGASLASIQRDVITQ